MVAIFLTEIRQNLNENFVLLNCMKLFFKNLDNFIFLIVLFAEA